MPEAWPSMRSTARWVLPVLVGPRTAMSREASPRAGEQFMNVNVEDAGASRKSEPIRRDPDLSVRASLLFPGPEEGGEALRTPGDQ